MFLGRPHHASVVPRVGRTTCRPHHVSAAPPLGGVEASESPLVRHGVSLEESSFKLAATEIFCESCFDRRRALERRLNVRATARPHDHALLCEIQREIASQISMKATGKARAYPTKSGPADKSCGSLVPWVGSDKVLRVGNLLPFFWPFTCL